MYCLLFKLEQSCVEESTTTKIVPKLVIHSNIFKGYLLATRSVFHVLIRLCPDYKGFGFLQGAG